MRNARFIVAAILLAGAALAACSGNFGSGTTPPGGLLPSGSLAGIQPTPTPTPNSANGIITYGDSEAFQQLPNAAGYGGAIAFPVPSPKPSGFSPVPVGVTLSVVAPTDAPDLNLAKPGKHPTKRERPARALVYISLLATRDISLDSYPRIAIDVPRDVVTVYREEEIQIALFNSGEKTKTYTFAAAEHDTASPPPTPSPPPSAPPKPTPVGATSSSASSSASPGASPGASAIPSGFPTGALTPVPSAAATNATPSGPTPSPTLPPQRILFAGTAASLKLSANKPVIFAVYALPIETPAPTASRSPAAHASGSPTASGSAASSASSAAPSSAASAGPSTAPTASASSTQRV